jgi:hypothetical protein
MEEAAGELAEVGGGGRGVELTEVGWTPRGRARASPPPGADPAGEGREVFSN